MNAPTKIIADANRPRAVIGHMPFFDHRNMAQVREDEAREAILRGLGRDR